MPKPAGDQAESKLVSLRVGTGEKGVVAEVDRSEKVIEELIGQAARWMYVMRNRSRWAGDEDSKEEVYKSARKTCHRLGISDKVLKDLVTGDSLRVEPEFHWPKNQKDEAFDAACCMPWEFLLSSATHAAGRSMPMLISRHLSPRKPRDAGKGPNLYVESAPGRIDDWYSFDSERARLEAALGNPSSASNRKYWQVESSPIAEDLEAHIGTMEPRIVHFSGVDNHQAQQIVPGFYKEEAIAALLPEAEHKKKYPLDGAILRGKQLAEVPVWFSDLARHLVGGTEGVAPVIVTLNAYYTGSRTARNCVREGAHAAIGFLDQVDDEVAEFFFQAFYWQWRELKLDENCIADAFENTWYQLRNQGTNLFGTGIVLWLARSAFQMWSPRAKGKDETRAALPTAAQRDRTRKLPIGDVLQVDLQVRPDLNYSLLHNARPLVESLTLNKLTDHALDEVTVEVQLNAGDDSLPFRYTEKLLDQPQRALADRVRIPLTAALLRASRERVQSTLYAKVTWDGRTAFEETRPITLLPVDEWFDDTSRNPWLPSFVLPRDPAIPKIMERARRHLITLQDDPTAGFDGYQSVELDEEEWPYDCDAIDEQVQAIWTALVQDYRLAYINPPPSYSERNQRLRAPSEMLATSSGTCIDLSLLLASCLEYVDIYPVVVLLTGHAFVGYWRAEQYHDDFTRVARVPKDLGLQVGVDSMKSSIPLVDAYGWRLAQQQYREILRHLRADQLRFLEATGLCFNYSFAEALDEGRGNIRSESDFDSLLDIALARSATPPVTPLPIVLTSER